MADAQGGSPTPPAVGAAVPVAWLPSSALRLMLEGLREIAGPQYERLLRSAGLTEYLHMLPPDDPRPALDRAQLAQFNQAIFQMLGEPLTRLFYRNIGTASAAAFGRSPLVPQMLARIAQLPEEQHYEWVVQRLLSVAVWGWSSTTPAPDAVPWYEVSEDAGAWYLSTTDCSNCVGVRRATAPLCAWVPALFIGLAKVYGQRVAVHEIECLAQGAPHCKYAVEKHPTVKPVLNP